MLTELRRSLLLLAAFTVLLGGLYPLAITGVAQLAFPRAANGSLIVKDGQVIGSELIGQSFTDPKYFWSRPSAAGNGYDANNSSGSNLAPSSAKLVAAVTERAAAISAVSDGRNVPIDLVTASGSGLDPHISPKAALLQVTRVAKARGLKDEDVRSLVRANIEAPALGIFGERRVNVLKLNIALDALPKSASPSVQTNGPIDGPRQ